MLEKTIYKLISFLKYVKKKFLFSCLTTIFESDLTLPGGTSPNSPHVDEFLDELMPQLNVLFNHHNSMKRECEVLFKKLLFT